MRSTRLVVGYLRGKPFKLIVASREGKWLEASTAIAWDEMREAAAKDGIDLELSSGWRSHEEQTRIYNERLDPAVRAVKGVAAKPGWSNHQSGWAIDIHTGMTLADLQHGRKSDIYKWLEAHAGEHGFVRTVASEPWHWSREPPSEDRS